MTGAGGFIGHHLTTYLVDKGYWVRGVDIKQQEYASTDAHEFQLLDLRYEDNCLKAADGVDEVYDLAANMGGIGFIESNKAEIMHDNVLINIHMPKRLWRRYVLETPRFLPLWAFQRMGWMRFRR